MTCSSESCSRPARAQGLCNAHHAARHRWPARSEAERFWSHVDRRGPDECWEWQGARRNGGYGTFDNQVASRWSLERALGRPLSSDEQACHHCDNPPCVNPAHLFVGDAATNAADMIAKGRSAVGAKHGSKTRPAQFRSYTKLTASVIPDIRRRLAWGEPVVSIARAYGVSPWTVYDVSEGRTWKHVP